MLVVMKTGMPWGHAGLLLFLLFPSATIDTHVANGANVTKIEISYS
ncbi:hypothetical protein CORMATOL_01364 [Corynebacterium matruchotii ATCC 33806]|uniref:Uncharacterized protein n=1 Tax=Corynebacterium matruchotii ATCC 33806 TaxID=566549 RepID=C0E302_9CORY|nr:hypothetical protein CORMATOL_01364 [Corynebacterium matruchotii ATCC 33806]